MGGGEDGDGVFCIIQYILSTNSWLINTNSLLMANPHKLQANKWCAAGLEMLTSLQLEGCHSEDDIQKAVADIDKFVASAKDLKLNNPKEFRQLFDSVITSDTRVRYYRTIYLCVRVCVCVLTAVTELRLFKIYVKFRPTVNLVLSSQSRKVTIQGRTSGCLML